MKQMKQKKLKAIQRYKIIIVYLKNKNNGSNKRNWNH